MMINFSKEIELKFSESTWAPCNHIQSVGRVTRKIKIIKVGRYYTKEVPAIYDYEGLFKTAPRKTPRKFLFATRRAAKKFFKSYSAWPFYTMEPFCIVHSNVGGGKTQAMRDLLIGIDRSKDDRTGVFLYQPKKREPDPRFEGLRLKSEYYEKLRESFLVLGNVLHTEFEGDVLKGIVKLESDDKNRVIDNVTTATTMAFNMLHTQAIIADEVPQPMTKGLKDVGPQ